jgi:hypothetical protein
MPVPTGKKNYPGNPPLNRTGESKMLRDGGILESHAIESHN